MSINRWEYFLTDTTLVGGMAVVGLYTSSCATQEKQELYFL